ncbi:MAG TPA: mersacidin/lichenicidin family type 2 lantibiotic [Pyrinomonadaceae bacterium]|nr:mersacidin/lichenicidin family type 2 lantibiotic [Pyrinomonadaceae bacterium]
MSNVNIVRAWKDEEYRRSLSEAERAMLPQNPAGMIELNDKDLETVAGGDTWTEPCLYSWWFFSLGCCLRESVIEQ